MSKAKMPEPITFTIASPLDAAAILALQTQAYQLRLHGKSSRSSDPEK
jgi:hypothetical protein